jgi:insertion element IS1 protein InsB
MTDYWRPDEAFVPPARHTQSKAETYTVEGYNSLFRHFLARLRRKYICYSKCQKMLETLGSTLDGAKEWMTFYIMLAMV